jgi:ABC-type nitrate/sulfonate/bicarbonate transport system substrate-binding protein
VPTRRDALCQTAASLLLCGAGAGCAPKRAGRLTIGNTSGVLNQTMAELMRRQGFLESFGLSAKILEVADGSKILGGIVGGSLDASLMSGIGQVFPAIEQGGQLRIIGAGIVLPSLALYTGKADIRSLKDLEGRTIGSGSIGALTYQLTVALLKQAGVAISKIRFANLGSSVDIFRGVVAGTVDAGVGPASYAANPSRYHVRLVPGGNMAEALSWFTYQGAWTSTRMIETARDTLVRALAAHGKLYRFVQSPSAKAAFIQARKTVLPRVPDQDHEDEWAFVQKYRPFASQLTIGPERLEILQRLNFEFGVQKAILPYARVADMTLAEDALKLLDS